MYGGFSRAYYYSADDDHGYFGEDATYMMKLNRLSHTWEPVSCRGAPADWSRCHPQTIGEQCFAVLAACCLSKLVSCSS